MLSQVELEFQEYDDERQWAEVYRRIKNESTLVPRAQEYSMVQARSPHNRGKNRYRDVNPYDHSRVVLQREDNNDYINASFVEVPEAGRKYILSQGPLEHTCGDFWLMVWQQKCKAVVMLNRVVEKERVKCAQYWPLGSAAGEEDDMIFEDVGLRVTLQGEQDRNNFIMRWLEIENMETGDKREILHFHYTTWPDFGVPTSPTAFLNFLKVVREAGALEASVGPVVVHCSAGIGRSGTFCLADSCLVLIEKYKSLSCVDVRNMLLSMRTYRMGLIQTPDQLRFSYLAIIHGGRILLGQDANSNIRIPDEESPHDEHDDVPPLPPIRVTSLPDYQQKSSLQSAENEDDDDETVENIDDELAALIDDDDERPPALPPKKGTPTDFDRLFSKEEEDIEESAYNVRRRVREERKRSTQEKIKNMKLRQRKSDIWKQRKSYFQPICLGLALVLGSYMIYRFYWRY